MTRSLCYHQKGERGDTSCIRILHHLNGKLTRLSLRCYSHVYPLRTPRTAHWIISLFMIKDSQMHFYERKPIVPYGQMCAAIYRSLVEPRDIYAAEGELECRVRAWSVERQERMDCLGTCDTSSVWTVFKR